MNSKVNISSNSVGTTNSECVTNVSSLIYQDDSTYSKLNITSKLPSASPDQVHKPKSTRGKKFLQNFISSRDGLENSTETRHEMKECKKTNIHLLCTYCS